MYQQAWPGAMEESKHWRAADCCDSAATLAESPESIDREVQLERVSPAAGLQFRVYPMERILPI